MTDKIPASLIDFNKLTPEQISQLAEALLKHMGRDFSASAKLAEMVEKHNKSRGGRRD